MHCLRLVLASVVDQHHVPSVSGFSPWLSLHVAHDPCLGVVLALLDSPSWSLSCSDSVVVLYCQRCFLRPCESHPLWSCVVWSLGFDFPLVVPAAGEPVVLHRLSCCFLLHVSVGYDIEPTWGFSPVSGSSISLFRFFATVFLHFPLTKGYQQLLGVFCTLGVAPPPLLLGLLLLALRVDLVCFGVSRPVSCVCLLFSLLFFGVLLRLVSSRSFLCRCMVVSPCVLFLPCLSRSFGLLLLLVSCCCVGYG